MPPKQKRAKVKAPPDKTTPKTTKTTSRSAPQSGALLKGSAREWLQENGYPDIANLIDVIMGEWTKNGIATRRNWWDILSGDRFGRARIVAGREFPVLAEAQRRQGKPVTENALSGAKSSAAPPIRESARWV